jgi:Domain of unknown function (DUF4124)
MPRWLPWSGAVLLCAALLVAPHAHAALWKWVDSNGRVVYSDIPPTADVKAERVSGPAPRANPNAVKELVSQEADLKKRQMQRVEDETKSEKSKAESTKKQEQCTLMRGQLKAMQMDNVQHYRVNEKGERVFLDATARKQQIDRIEAYLKEQCQPDH